MDATSPVILLGSDCLTGLQAARILWRRGVPVIGLAARVDSPYCRTRAVTRTVGEDALDDVDRLLDEARDAHGCRPALLACTDEHAWWLNEHRDAVAQRGEFLLPASDTLELLIDKGRFYRHAAGRGLPLPETRFAETAERLPETARELSFPLVLKPPRRTRAWLDACGGAKAFRLNDPEELGRVSDRLRDVPGELILQAWVPGPDSQSRELTVCLDAESRPLAAVVLQKLRQWTPETGTGSLAVHVDDDEALHTGLELLRALLYVGVGQLEFKRSVDDGRLYILEMNAGRLALNSPLAEACGIEMTYTWYCAAAGLPLPSRRQVSRPGAKWICWKRDLPSAWTGWRSGELTLRNWLRSLRGHKWSADVQLDDPLPLIAELFERAGRGVSREGRKR